LSDWFCQKNSSQSAAGVQIQVNSIFWVKFNGLPLNTRPGPSMAAAALADIRRLP
jgi:hypothetical protein